jgi:predicted nucleic acid-binding protein
LRNYLDSSFAVSLYSPDANSATAARIMHKSKGEHLISALGELEVANALELRVFRKQISATEARASAAAFEKDLHAGVFQPHPLTEEAFEKARQLSRQHTAHLGIRSADLIHVAAAITLQVDRLYTFDLQQRKLAQRIGIRMN